MPFKSNIIDEELYSIWSMFIENHKTNDIDRQAPVESLLKRRRWEHG